MVMVEEEYIAYRNQIEFPMILFYEYYKENNRKKRLELTFADFVTYFNEFLRNFHGGILHINGAPKKISYDGMIEKIYKFFNDKFQLNETE